MPTIKINTANLEADGRRINELAKSYNQLIDNMFNRLNSGIAKAWSGDASNRYRVNIAKDKEFFLKLGTYLQKYGNELINIADDFERKIRKWDN